MRSRKRQPIFTQGFILTEACVSMALVGLVLGVASLLLSQHARATEYFLSYRRAQLAAESCVERMRIGALDAADAGFVDDAGIRYEIRVTDAEAAWAPLRRVEVRAVVDENKSSVASYTLKTYLASTTTIGGSRP